jgi:hypothetical protein
MLLAPLDNGFDLSGDLRSTAAVIGSIRAANGERAGCSPLRGVGAYTPFAGPAPEVSGCPFSNAFQQPPTSDESRVDSAM